MVRIKVKLEKEHRENVLGAVLIHRHSNEYTISLYIYEMYMVRASKTETEQKKNAFLKKNNIKVIILLKIETQHMRH